MNIPPRNFIVFTDAAQRNIIAQLVSKGDDTLVVENPAIVAVVPMEGGKINMQLYPLFFREFMKDKNAKTTWNFNLAQVTISDIAEIDARVALQYEQLFYTKAVENGQVIPAEQEAKTDLFV